jgi:hypothetical protein
MEFLFEAQDLLRNRVLEVLHSIPEEKHALIPEGFNNHLIWNAAHIAVTQQILVYKLSGVETLIPAEILPFYQKGSSPREQEGPWKFSDVEYWLGLTGKKVAEDYKAGVFSNYKEYTTSAGITLHNANEALLYNYGHENLHYGTILALRKVLGG